jgi:arylsulfatase A-like enzyme
MDKLTKINLIIFSFLTLLSLISITLKTNNSGLEITLLLVLIFNSCLILLILGTTYKLYNISKKNYTIIFMLFLITLFSVWYILSNMLFFGYGTFLSLSGISYYLAVFPPIKKFIIFLMFTILIISLTFLLYKLTNSQKSEYKIKKRYFLILLTILILVIFLIPPQYKHSSSPIIDYFNKLIKPHPAKNYIPITSENSTNKIFNLELDLKNPNIIIIMLESISRDHIHFYGYERNISPNIDLLMNKSIVFNRTYSISSHSDYSQPGFLSSKYMLINDIRNSFDLPVSKTFIWDKLKKQNYSTAYISSQDDEWVNMIKYIDSTNLDYYSYSLSDNVYDYGSGNAKKDFDEKTTEKVISWLNSTDTSNPFFLYINLQATHYPYSYPENNTYFYPDETTSILSRYVYLAEEDVFPSINRYDNSLLYVDKQIGKIIEELEKKNLMNNSIIILTADHGESFNRTHRYIRHGYGCYEEEYLVPMSIYIPNQNNRIINNITRHIDVIPTIFDMINISYESNEFQGELMADSPIVYMASQNQNYKIGIIKDDIKYLIDMNSYLSEVYNLTEDSQELNNLIKSSEDEEYYNTQYGSYLWNWYFCQKDYYENKKYLSGEQITCK